MRFGSEAGRTRAAVTLCAVLCPLLCLGAAGCRHKKVQPVVLPQQTPVALEPVKTPEQPPMLETPKPEQPPVPVASAASRPMPRKKRSKPAVAAAPPPAPVEPPTQTVTAEGSPVATAIGELTPGGEQNSKTLQEASDLIASNEKRLGALSETKAKTQRSLISKVRNFQREAQQAMQSGDLEGAKTLATKAKLLLDDIEKEGAGQ